MLVIVADRITALPHKAVETSDRPRLSKIQPHRAAGGLGNEIALIDDVVDGAGLSGRIASNIGRFSRADSSRTAIRNMGHEPFRSRFSALSCFAQISCFAATRRAPVDLHEVDLVEADREDSGRIP